MKLLPYTTGDANRLLPQVRTVQINIIVKTMPQKTECLSKFLKKFHSTRMVEKKVKELDALG